jgi:hypothetical protein
MTNPIVGEPTRSLGEIASDYAPYNKFPTFYEGVEDYRAGVFDRRYANGLDQQAYDRGSECAMRFARQAHGYEA